MLDSGEKRVTTGRVDHKIAIQLKIDDLCAILAIVSFTGDAEYALSRRASPIDRRYFESW
jgi:hypothetical protein